VRGDAAKSAPVRTPRQPHAAPRARRRRSHRAALSDGQGQRAPEKGRTTRSEVPTSTASGSATPPHVEEALAVARGGAGRDVEPSSRPFIVSRSRVIRTRSRTPIRFVVLAEKKFRRLQAAREMLLGA